VTRGAKTSPYGHHQIGKARTFHVSTELALSPGLRAYANATTGRQQPDRQIADPAGKATAR